MRKDRRKNIVCPNCSTSLSEAMNFCPNCGQENHHHRVGVGKLMMDVFRENFSLDTKAIRSIVPLITRPGFLTTEFIHGKRASYNRPLRLYLFISFVYLVLNTTFDTPDTTTVDLSNTDDSSTPLGISFSENSDSTSADAIIADADSVQSNPFVDLYFPDAVEAIQTESGRQDFTDRMMDSLSVFLFLLIPMLGLWMFLLFYNRSFYYVDGFVFALHVQSAYFVGAIFVWLIQLIWAREIFTILLVFLIIVYTMIAAKRVYQVSWAGVVLRLIVVCILHSIAALVALLAYVIYLFTTFA